MASCCMNGNIPVCDDCTHELVYVWVSLALTCSCCLSRHNMKLKLNDKRDNQAVLKPWETQGPRMRPFRETKLGVSRECVPPHYEPGAFSLFSPSRCLCIQYALCKCVLFGHVHANGLEP